MCVVFLRQRKDSPVRAVNKLVIYLLSVIKVKTDKQVSMCS